MLFCIKEVGLYWYSSIRLNMDSGLVYIFRSNYFILNINNIWYDNNNMNQNSLISSVLSVFLSSSSLDRF